MRRQGDREYRRQAVKLSHSETLWCLLHAVRLEIRRLDKRNGIGSWAAARKMVRELNRECGV